MFFLCNSRGMFASVFDRILRGDYLLDRLVGEVDFGNSFACGFAWVSVHRAVIQGCFRG